MDRFELVSEYKPSGDQPEAITGLVNGINWGLREQTLLGVTGSGKTFTMASVMASGSEAISGASQSTRRSRSSEAARPRIMKHTMASTARSPPAANNVGYTEMAAR